MPRTYLVNLLAEASRRVALTEPLSRRTMLGNFAGASLAAGISSMDAGAAAAPGSTNARVVVVGAGLAGLTCAYRLKQAGINARVYEASDRVGGRCWTGRGEFAEGQIYEHGGELIDTGHKQIRQLVQEIGLATDNLYQAELNGTEPFFYFDFAPYSLSDATADLKSIWQKIHSDVSAASYPTLYNSYTQRGWELDHMSIRDWIAESVPGGLDSRLGQLLDVAYNIEYGAECSDQSSLNLLYLLGYSGQGQLRIFGPSNEKFHVRGGNDQIVARLAQALLGQVTTGAALTAVRQNTNGGVTLSFRIGSRVTDVAADRVVLALPFSILRSSVDCSAAGFNTVKQWAIAEQGMGSNAKLHLQFDRRHWESLGCNGETFADTGYQNTWEVTRAQAGTAGILVDYTGGNVALSMGENSLSTNAKKLLGGLEAVLPGIGARWNGRATLDCWPSNPYTRGSYSYWRVGQYTRFAGAEREPSGSVHFAGEHTSVDFQGYLNGAVESGERAAAEIASALK